MRNKPATDTFEGEYAPMSNSTQNIKEWAGDPMHPRDSTQNDEIEVDGETYVKWDTQNDWEKKLFNIVSRSASESAEYQYKQLHDLIHTLLADARRESNRAVQWVVSHDTGSSSKVIWSVMMGVEPTWTATPYDEADYGRCVRLLQFIPEWQSRLDEVVEKYPRWKEAIDHILATLREEEKKDYSFITGVEFDDEDTIHDELDC